MRDSSTSCGFDHAQADGALGKIGQHVERGQRRRGGLQPGQRDGQPVEQRLVQLAFAGERPVARTEHLVLEALQLRRDVALGILHRLPPHPVGRHLVGLAAAHFDVVALHAVVAEAQVGEPGALAFARLEIEQRFVAVLADAAQFVQVGVVAGSDDAAFAQHRRRCRHQRAREQRKCFRMRARTGRQLLHERRIEDLQQILELGQAAERLAQLRQIARSRRAQRDAREDALDVADAAQQLVQWLMPGRVEDRFDGLQTQFALCAAAQRPLHPASQLAAAHRRRRAVEHADQRAFRASGHVRVELEIASRGRVEQQGLVARLAADAAQMGQRRFLRLADVVQQATRGADCERLRREPEPGEIAGAELLAQLPLGAALFEMPGRALADGTAKPGWQQ